MPLSWNEIRANSLAFSRDWAGATREHAEAKTFWDEFFAVFGLKRRLVASFEEPVKGLSGSYGFIDLFWKGILLAEHKSKGKDLGKAHSQAMDYIQDLQRTGRGDEVPKFVIVSDFARIALHDLESGSSTEVALGELHKRIQIFGFIPGYEQHRLEADDPTNLKAVAIMGDLHDALEAGGYQGHDLERMLVRVLFCLFAEDTGIFERSAFELFLKNHTNEDGSDLGSRLAQYFSVLNTSELERQKNLQEELAVLPYVNGDLFKEPLGFAVFTRDMRNALISCTRFDWSRISPAVFGALFQSVMEPKERRQKGAHYTSERDILKTIGPLFLDELKESLEKVGNSKPKLRAFMERLRAIRLLDPACGCGNFLVIAYRELRLLELEALKRLHNKRSKDEYQQPLLDASTMSNVDVDQLYGIEIEEWPARIAEVAIWLMDHQMNQRLSEAFGLYYVRLPLIKSPHIAHANALQMSWSDVLQASECTYVLGNPPFIGKQYRNSQQNLDMEAVWGNIAGVKSLDYVTCWHKKSREYIANGECEVAFVSTNSISQGEQVSTLWHGIRRIGPTAINFAYRTFAWKSEAKGTAHVHVVIIGFSKSARQTRLIIESDPISLTQNTTVAKNINPYLVDGPDIVISNRTKPICHVPDIVFGSMPNDGGALILSDAEREIMISNNPGTVPFIRKFVGSDEFINGIKRWCLWLVDAEPSTLRSIPDVLNRISDCKRHRLASSRPTTRKLAETPSIFGEIRQPTSNYLLIPSVSSERRKYIPIGFCEPEIVASNLTLVVPNAELLHFGVLTSSMHMAWVRTVCGRLESRYRYSAKLVYNNFPWPQSPTEKQRIEIESAAQAVLDSRLQYPDSTLADLYDPLSMPAELTTAHNKLDRAVEKCYRSKPFPSDRSRVEYLFELYQQLTKPLIAEAKRRKS